MLYLLREIIYVIPLSSSTVNHRSNTVLGPSQRSHRPNFPLIAIHQRAIIAMHDIFSPSVIMQLIKLRTLLEESAGVILMQAFNLSALLSSSGCTATGLREAIREQAKLRLHRLGAGAVRCMWERCSLLVSTLPGLCFPLRTSWAVY